MSKVVHLTAEAHTRAKDFCERHGLKMSHWVAELIQRAVAGEGRGEGAAAPASWPAQGATDGAAAAQAEGAAGRARVVGAPPFWADTPAP